MTMPICRKWTGWLALVRVPEKYQAEYQGADVLCRLTAPHEGVKFSMGVVTGLTPMAGKEIFFPTEDIKVLTRDEAMTGYSNPHYVHPDSLIMYFGEPT